MTEDYYDEKIFTGDANFLIENMNLYERSRKIRILRTVSAEMIEKLGLDISMIAQKEHKPYRKRFFPFDFGKKPPELIMVPKSKNLGEMSERISNFLEKNYPYIDFENDNYRNSEAFYLSINNSKYRKSRFKNYWKGVLERVH